MLSKQKAFSKVNATFHNPLAMEAWLGPLEMSPESYTKAKASIAFPKEKAKHAMFWFERLSESDDIFVERLALKDVEGALKTIEGRNDHAACQNRLMTCLLQDDWKGALAHAEMLYHEEEDILCFSSVVTGSGGLTYIGLLALCNTSVWKEIVKRSFENTCVNNIETILHITENVEDSDLESLGRSVESLEKACDNLDCLKMLKGDDDIVYRMLAKKVTSRLWEQAKIIHKLKEDKSAKTEWLTGHTKVELIVRGRKALRHTDSNALKEDIVDTLTDIFAWLNIFQRFKYWKGCPNEGESFLVSLLWFLIPFAIWTTFFFLLKHLAG